MLAGCVDFKWGSHWKAESNSWTKNPKPYYATEWISYQCNSLPLTVATYGFEESAIATFFLIPLVPLGQARYPKTLKMFVISENLKSHCTSPAKDTFAIKVNGNTSTNYSITKTLNEDSCLIEIMESPETINSFEIQANESILQCETDALKVNKSSHVCLRATEFGGSESCAY